MRPFSIKVLNFAGYEQSVENDKGHTIIHSVQRIRNPKPMLKKDTLLRTPF